MRNLVAFFPDISVSVLRNKEFLPVKIKDTLQYFQFKGLMYWIRLYENNYGSK